MELHCKTFGQGEPVILLHGLFGTLDNWQTIGRALAEHYSVYLLDQRNHGHSPHTSFMDYTAMAEDLHRFMEHHWIFGAHIIGHSMGGKTAMQFALHYPDMVDKLIVIDIAPRAYPRRHQEIFDALFALDLDNLATRQEADEQLRQRIPDDAIRQFLLKSLIRRRGGGYAWRMNLAAIYKHYNEILASIDSDEEFDKPALFIRGGRSDYVQDDDFPGIRRQFPQARIETLPGAGHWVHVDAREAMLDLMTNFLAGSQLSV